MKNMLLIVFALISFSSCSQEVSFDTIERKNEIVYIKGTDTPYTGKVVSYYQNGKKSAEFSYVDGIENGINRTWYASGQISNETQIKDHKINGLWVDWYENGYKKNEVTYQEDYMLVNDIGGKKMVKNRKEGNIRYGKQKDLGHI